MATTLLTRGDTTPGFSLSDSTGAIVSLNDIAESRTVVYFYPAAFTPGCTTEACDFRDNLASLRAAGCAVVGISPDPVERLAEFAAAETLAYPLLSDVGSTVAKAWGAWGPKIVDGRQSVGALRSSFIVDRSGRVIEAYYNVVATGHVAAIRQALGV